VHPAQLVRIHDLSTFNENGITAPLSPHLDDATAPLHGIHHLKTFLGQVTHRLLDVNILASRNGINDHLRVPMVRGGNNDGVDVLIIKNFTEVNVAFGATVGQRKSGIQIRFINITNCA
jgi:hypothetical protein